VAEITEAQGEELVITVYAEVGGRELIIAQTEVWTTVHKTLTGWVWCAPEGFKLDRFEAEEPMTVSRVTVSTPAALRWVTPVTTLPIKPLKLEPGQTVTMDFDNLVIVTGG
jgi:hypothetical protein